MDIKLGFISDTHNYHLDWYDKLQYNEFGFDLYDKWNDMDILIFSGDCSSRGSKRDVWNFFEWFDKQPGQKVFIAGNHDFFFDLNLRNYDHRSSLEQSPEEEVEELLNAFPNINYLNDSGVNLYGLNIWGSPVTPRFGRWAFNRDRKTVHVGDNTSSKYSKGELISEHWDIIPDVTDILVTHGPPAFQGDLLDPMFRRRGEPSRVGCVDLANAIERIKPKVNVFGHIHEGYGKYESDGVTYINASNLDANYRAVNPPQFMTITV